MKRWLRPAVIAVVAGLAVTTTVTASPGHLEGYLPVAAHGAGSFDSFWTTDVWIYQQGASVIHLWFNPSGRDNTANQSVVVALDAPVVHLEDVVASVFASEGIGSIHYLADGPVEVISRTWTPNREGAGTYGQTIRGIPIGRASVAGTGQAGALRMLVDKEAGSRANLGLANVSPVALTVAVEIFTADGEAAPGSSSFTVDLEPFDMIQVGDVLARVDAATAEALIVRATVASSQGAVVAYLSTADDTTNDASYQEGFRFGY